MGVQIEHIFTHVLCTYLHPKFGVFTWAFYGLAPYEEGKDIVMFRFTVEHSSLRDFGPS
jgi:hypothetical protein